MPKKPKYKFSWKDNDNDNGKILSFSSRQGIEIFRNDYNDRFPKYISQSVNHGSELQIEETFLYRIAQEYEKYRISILQNKISQQQALQTEALRSKSLKKVQSLKKEVNKVTPCLELPDFIRNYTGKTGFIVIDSKNNNKKISIDYRNNDENMPAHPEVKHHYLNIVADKIASLIKEDTGFSQWPSEEGTELTKKLGAYRKGTRQLIQDQERSIALKNLVKENYDWMAAYIVFTELLVSIALIAPFASTLGITSLIPAVTTILTTTGALSFPIITLACGIGAIATAAAAVFSFKSGNNLAQKSARYDEGLEKKYNQPSKEAQNQMTDVELEENIETAIIKKKRARSKTQSQSTVQITAAVFNRIGSDIEVNNNNLITNQNDDDTTISNSAHTDGLVVVSSFESSALSMLDHLNNTLNNKKESKYNLEDDNLDNSIGANQNNPQDFDWDNDNINQSTSSNSIKQPVNANSLNTTNNEQIIMES